MSTHEPGEAGPNGSGDQAPIITVVGATATGKSDLALDLAEHLGGEIINTDSMQFYRGMDIGTAKLPVEERRGIPHHLIDILDVTAEANVQDFQARARTAIADIRNRGHRPILVGGSGLYVRAAVDHMEFPGTDPDIRARLEAEAAADRWSLHQRLRELDPKAAEKITVNDQRRIARALEVIELTGRAFSAQLPDYQEIEPTIHLGLSMDRPILHERIAARVELMWDQGWVDEVRSLLEVGLAEGRTASRAIGYAQIRRHLDGELSAAEAKEETIVRTRQFARRQDTWFRRDPRIHWIDGSAADAERNFEHAGALIASVGRES
ncbi:tRNA (adenosine(37)-N6)-dimethylallyltransferase MiaA [Brevibacterium sp.]|uniref:tRNA (adenosine(37)-N6)-dimethylallyltransferase MiaA n=1 Tax=Brevibacterium sp. TaxID=1701 RepID=UPI00261EC232|nr:tRNA (adenosine(37)-N6)-dimethylallyltransferase MiaA [Brevibacterium sp.]